MTATGAQVFTVSPKVSFDPATQMVTLTVGPQAFTFPLERIKTLQNVQQFDWNYLLLSIVILGKQNNIADGDWAALKTLVEASNFQVM